MTSLLDIAPSVHTVKVQGTDIPVPGISIAGLAFLLGQYPELRKMISGKAVEFSADQIFDLAPNVVQAVIAVGLGYPGDKDQEAAAGRLPMGDQMALIEGVLKATFRDGIGPFVDRLTALADLVGDDSASGIRERASKSLKASKP